MRNKISKYRFILIALAVVAIAVVLFGLIETAANTDISLGSDPQINITPEKITEIKEIGQWEFLSVVDEQVVDTVRKVMLMPDDRLTCIYYGTLRLGIDLKKAPKDWVENHGDSLIVTLPAPGLLDTKFIDEARTQVFYERGRWGAAAKEQMYRRAAKRMKTNALTPENLLTVRQAAERRFEGLFKSLGAKDVKVQFSDPWQ